MTPAKQIFLLAFSISWVCSIFTCMESKDLLNLRRARNDGTFGRFAVPRPLLEAELERLGLNGKVELLTSTKYNSASEGEIGIFVQTAEDPLLKEELTPDLQNQVTITATTCRFTLPVVACDRSHVVMILVHFSDAPLPFLSPYVTNYQAVQHIERIEVGESFVKLVHGCDVMHISFSHEDGCHDDAEIGADFDDMNGKGIHITNFPAEFDWGCNILGRNISFCRKLEPIKDAIDEANGDVCTKASTRKSIRCPASMTVENMTGVFREALPFFTDMVPFESFEAEWLDREHDMGITFPCW